MNKLASVPLVLGISGLIIAFSVGYYFIWYLPQEKASQDLTQNQANCLQLQSKVLEENEQQVAALGSDPGMTNTFSATNHYNPDLKKCIVEIDESSISTIAPINGKSLITTYDSASIVDAVEDSGIASCDVSRDSQTGKRSVLTCTDAQGNQITEAKFYAIETKYMGRQEPSL